MFSWGAQKPEPPKKPEIPKSFDPLKGGKGAAAFYELRLQAPEDAAKPNFKLGSAAMYYGKSPITTAAPSERKRKGEGEPIVPCQGVDELNALLRLGKEQLANPASRTLFKVIISSEAADLDAVATSLVFASVVYQREANASPEANLCPLPLILTKRADFRLRTEAHWLLQTMGVDLSLLCFADEVDLMQLHQSGRLQVVLLGIKKMPDAFTGLEAVVSEIIPSPALTPALDTPAPPEDGYSASVTLAKRLSEDYPEVFLNQCLCRLLLASILLSTNNLDASQSTEVDASMAAFLIIGAGGSGRHTFYDQLRDKKYNQTFLTTDELLRSDFVLQPMGPGTRGKKGGEVLQVGIANVGVSTAEMVGKDVNWDDKVKEFQVKNNLHALVILPTYYSTTNKRFKKEIIVVAQLSSLLSGLSFFLQQEKNALKLRAITVRGMASFAQAFTVGNTLITRLDIERLLIEYFDDGR